MKRMIFLMSMILAVVALAACGGSAAPAAVSEETAVIDVTSLPEQIDVDTAAALLGRDDVVLIDVREQWEYDEGHIPGITHIPMGEIASRLNEIPQDKTVVLTCRSGNRSGQVFDFLQQNGFDNVHNMQGGILAWQAAGFEVEQ